MKLFSDAGQRWADQDHGRWEPGDDTRADLLNDMADKNATDPGFLTDVCANGFGLSAVTATLLANYETLGVQGRATLAARLYNDIYRAVHRATEAEL